MTKWKYLKGSEKDFDGAPDWATECVWNDKGGESFCYWLSKNLNRVSFNGLVVEWDGEYGWRNYIKAQREPIADEDDLNECIGATESITMHGKPLSELIGVEYATFNSAQFGIPSHGYCDGEKVGELHIDSKEHVAFLGSKYHREIKPGVWVDVYDVLKAWSVTNPALQHLIKKALQPGERGHKTLEQDMQDIIDSAIRAKELEINQ